MVALRKSNSLRNFKKNTSNPVDKTAVLMRLPRMELHWKKKKKRPKNFAITASTSPSSSSAANLNWAIGKECWKEESDLQADCVRYRALEYFPILI